jgi:Ohr subfamily peroxiredoxin
MNILYTAEATVTGGREGHGWTSDGRLNVNLSVPATMGGSGGAGTNPEQLLAIAFAAYFQSTLLNLAKGRKLNLENSTVTARLGIGPTGHGRFGLTIWLCLHAPQLSRADAERLMIDAHARCPYSNATRANVEVTLSTDAGILQQQQQSAARGARRPRVTTTTDV